MGHMQRYNRVLISMPRYKRFTQIMDLINFINFGIQARWTKEASCWSFKRSNILLPQFSGGSLDSQAIKHLTSDQLAMQSLSLIELLIYGQIHQTVTAAEQWIVEILYHPLAGVSPAHPGHLRLWVKGWGVSDPLPSPCPLPHPHTPLRPPCLSSGPLHPDPLPTLWLPPTSSSACPAPRVASVQKPIWEPRPRGRAEDSRRRPPGESKSFLKLSFKVSSTASY